MKIRNGFVSNSSSSSFVIYGAEIENMNYEEIQEKIKNSCLRMFEIDYEIFYVGRSWDSIKDEETGLDFKNSIENAVKEIFPNENLKCDKIDTTF